MCPILKATGVTKKFNENETVLKGVDLEVAENSFTVILGPSGSGKSTLMNVMSGLLKPTSGQVKYKEQDIVRMSRTELADWKRNCVGNIFQNYLLLPNLTVKENILIGLPDTGNGLKVGEVAALLGIDSLMNKFPAQLSGGQQQRTAIARAIIKHPDILFCDEATGALDEENSKSVIRLLHGIHKDYGTTILFITHNLKIAETAERIIIMKDGRIASNKTNEHPLSPDKLDWGV